MYSPMKVTIVAALILASAQSQAGVCTSLLTSLFGRDKANPLYVPDFRVPQPDVSQSPHKDILSSTENIRIGHPIKIVGGREGYLAGVTFGASYAMVTDKGAGIKFNDNRGAIGIAGGWSAATIMTIADAKGGSIDSNVASKSVVDSVLSGLMSEPGAMSDVVSHARSGLKAEVETWAASGRKIDPRAGATMATVVLEHNRLSVGHIGDAKVLVLRSGKLIFESHDHTLLQMLIDFGRVSRHDAFTDHRRHQVDRLISLTPHHENDKADVNEMLVRDGDVIMLVFGRILDQIERDTLINHARREKTAAKIALRVRAAAAEALAKFSPEEQKDRDGNISIGVIVVGGARK